MRVTTVTHVTGVTQESHVTRETGDTLKSFRGVDQLPFTFLSNAFAPRSAVLKKINGNKLEASIFEPGADGRGARVLPLCYAALK